MSEFDDIERTLCQLPQVHVFKIPVRKTAEGHRASDWPKDPSWSGKLKIVAKGKVAAIILMDDKNNVFAICQVTDDGAVERTLDSGRYFVLRITNQQGRHAFIGIAFNERNDAFDFNVALSEFKNEIEREEKASKLFSQAIPAAAPVDMTLKSGEKIKIKLSGKKKNDDEQQQQPAQPSLLGRPGGLLAPPSGFASSFSHSTAHAPAPAPVHTTNHDPFGSHTTTTTTTNKASDPFGSDPFGSNPFGSSDPFASDPFGSSSDPFASSTTTSQPSKGATDAFGFPIHSNSSSAGHTKSTPNTSVNLLDF